MELLNIRYLISPITEEIKIKAWVSFFTYKIGKISNVENT